MLPLEFLSHSEQTHSYEQLQLSWQDVASECMVHFDLSQEDSTCDGNKAYSPKYSSSQQIQTSLCHLYEGSQNLDTLKA